jgi:DNA protecting protein DprA
MAQGLAAMEIRSHWSARYLKKDRAGWITLWDDLYPSLLYHTFDPPAVLFWEGDEPVSFRSQPEVNRTISGSSEISNRKENSDKANSIKEFSAIVGTRKPAPISEIACELLVERIKNDVIVSGLALGIDRKAHLSAIKEKTDGIAVLASGTPKAGPQSNLDILRIARESGVAFTLISEFAPSVEARNFHFPRRNRIIAGLCEKTYVIQAPAKSGSLITARFALDAGRDVHSFDHPSLGNGVNEGCRNLLFDGAIPIAFDSSDLGVELITDPEKTDSQGYQLEFWKKKSHGEIRNIGQGLYYIEENKKKI